MELETLVKIPKNQKIVVVCLEGTRRSPTLAQYLKEFGYDAISTGIMLKGNGQISKDLKEILDSADCIITVHPTIQRLIKEKGYKFQENQRSISLDVDDQYVTDDKSIAFRDMNEVRQELINQIQPYLQK